MNKIKYCENCHKQTEGQSLCEYCLDKLNNKKMIKNEDGEWVTPITEENKNKFYNETKEYVATNLMYKYEKKFYNELIENIDKKYVVIPQVNMQTIINVTNSNKRNDELYRNIDFVIFDGCFYPLLAIEINDKTHYTSEFTRTRDMSVKQILDKADIPLISIIKEDIDYDYNVKKYIKQINEILENKEPF